MYFDIVSALSCLHLFTHTCHWPTHDSFVSCLVHTHCIFVFVTCHCMSICQSCDHVPPCLSSHVSQPFCLSCPVLSCCVLACQPINDDWVSWEWVHPGLDHLSIWGQPGPHSKPPLLRFSHQLSIWQLFQNAQLWLAGSWWGFRPCVFHTVMSFDQMASWEQDLVMMNGYVKLKW